MVATDQTVYKIRCQVCQKEYSIIADRNDMEAWLSGEKYIQDALSYLSAADREMFISETCGVCWAEMYGIDDEE